MTENERDVARIAVDEYDRLQAEYEGLPGMLKTGTSTIRVVPFIATHGVSTWIVQTMRVPDKGGDYVFVDRVGGSGALRLVLPPDVTLAIARQRDKLTTKARSRAAKERARSNGNASHLNDPAVRAKALAARKAKAARRRARKENAK